MKVQVFTSFPPMSSGYASFFRKCMIDNSVSSLEFYCITNEKFKMPEGFHMIPVHESHSGRLDFGTLMNETVKFATERFAIISHVDVAITLKCWDQYFMKCLENARWVGLDPAVKKFPPIASTLFSMIDVPTFVSRRVDLTAENVFVEGRRRVKKILIDSFEDECKFGIPIGKWMKQDGGWRIPLHYSRDEIVTIPPVPKLTLQFKDIDKKSLKRQLRYLREYAIDGRRLAVHFGCSNTVPFDSPLVKSWTNSLKEG